MVGLRWFFVVSLLFSSQGTKADEVKAQENLITWRVTDWAPFYILQGKMKGMGLYDQLLDAFEEALPEYAHRRVNMTTQRVLFEMKLEHNVCHPSVLADTDAHLSKVNSILLPHKLFVKKGVAQAYPGDEISLVKLMADERFLGGLSRGRYTASLNQLASIYEKQKNILDVPYYESLIKMFFNRRVDYIIEYPAVMTYRASIHDKKVNYSERNIAETADTPFLKVYVACPKNVWGRKIIDRVNQVLLKESQDKQCIQQRLFWYAKESRQELKTIYLREYFLDK